MSDATREVIVAWIEEETTAFAETFAAKALVCGGGGVEVARMPRASAAVLLALGHADAMPGDLGGRESVFDGVAGHVAACPAFFDAMKRVVDAATDAYLGAGDDDDEEEEEEEEGEEGGARWGRGERGLARRLRGVHRERRVPGDAQGAVREGRRGLTAPR